MAITSSFVREEVRSGKEQLALASREPNRDAELLLCRVLGKDRSWLLAHRDAPLTRAQIEQYKTLLARRARHEPMQYILGEQEFYGLRFAVSSDVLIPRPETEHLVEAALALLPANEPVRVADVGTGSGAIAVAIAHERPLAEVVALDVSPSSLQIARVNAEAHGVSSRMRFLESDLLDAVRGERFAMIVSNPPYIPDGEVLEAQVRDWEPPVALYAGAEGLSIYKPLIPQARRALMPGGWLVLEIGHGQQQPIQALLAGWQNVEFVNDLQGIPRIAIGRRGPEGGTRVTK